MGANLGSGLLGHAVELTSGNTLLLLLIDLFKELLVVRKFLLVHLARNLFALLGTHLALEEVLVIEVDILDLLLESLLLELVVLLVLSPDLGLLVVVSLVTSFSHALLIALGGEELSHLLLFGGNSGGSLLVFEACSHFLLHFITHKGLVFVTLALLLLPDDIASKLVHEVLCSRLTLLELVLSIGFLLVEEL